MTGFALVVPAGVWLSKIKNGLIVMKVGGGGRIEVRGHRAACRAARCEDRGKNKVPIVTLLKP